MTATLPKSEKLAEGKTKILFAVPSDAELVIMEHKDAITAGDGARRHVLIGKAVATCETMDHCFRLLERSGIPTHYARRLDERRTLVRRCVMVPVEVVARRLATGSYLKRHPEMAEGSRFDPPVVELFLKDDLRHDPLVTPRELINAGVAGREDVEAMLDLAGRAFVVMEQAWARLGVTLVDLKIECGRDAAGRMVVADVIDNDSWRLWPGGRRADMLDKQVYRELAEVTEAHLADVLANYRRVAEMSARFDD